MLTPGEAADLAALERELARSLCLDAFADFCAHFWPFMTGRALVPNRATTAMCEVLQAVADGSCPRLLIAIPPGLGKSTTLALYDAWRRARDPAWRCIHGSHGFALAATESRRVRRLIEGDEYRRMFPHVVLRTDESTVEHWATTADGRYFAVGTDGGLTGRRAHEAVLDDPLNAPDRFSKTARDRLFTWFQETLSSRLDGDRAPIVVVQQRLDRDDLIGRLIAAGGWTLLELPAEAADGTLLAPNVLSREKLDVLKAQIGSAAYATQYLQRPHDDSTSLVKRAWLTRRWTELPERRDRTVIALDATFKAGDSSDFAVIQCWVASGGDRLLVEQWRRQAGFADTLAALKAMATRHPSAKVVVELAANGHAIVDQLRREIPGVVGVKPIGSKVARASSVQAIFESGAVVLPAHAPWVDEWIEEVTAFSASGSGAVHDDQLDAAVWALREFSARVMPMPDGGMGGTVDGPRSPRPDAGSDDRSGLDLYRGWKP